MNDNNFFDEMELKPREPQRAYQWKYTACRYNIENANGFYTFSKSAEISPEEKEELIEAVAHYGQPDSAPLRPSREELADPTQFPIAFTSFKLSGGKSVICRARAVGQDYGGTRYGNFFAHAFVLSDGEWRDPIRYFVSQSFTDGLSPEEANLGKTPEPLPSLRLEDVAAGSSPAPFSTDLNALRALVDGFVEALRRRKNLIVGASPENLAKAANFLGDFLAVLPTEIASKIEFTTYSRNPTIETLFIRAKYVFLAFAPLEAARAVPKDKAVVVDLDAAIQGKPNVVASYAKVLSPKFLEFARSFVYAGKIAPAVASNASSFDSFEVVPEVEANASSFNEDERTLDLRYLNGLTTIYATTRGVFPQIERGWDDVWEFLSADKKTVLSERWIETWRFLNEQPFDVCLGVAQKLLKLDLTRFAKPGLPLQEKVLGIEAFTERIGYLKNRFDVMLTRNILSYVVVFCAKICAKNRLENLEATNEIMRRFVAFWRRVIPLDSSANKEWRGALPREISEIFDLNSPAGVATIGCEERFAYGFDALGKLVLDSFLELPNPSVWESWLAIALGIQFAIEKPEKLDAQTKECLQKCFSSVLEVRKNALTAFEFAYFPLFIEKITIATSYSLIFDIIGARNDEKRLKNYANRLVSDESLNAWKRGKSLKRSNASNSDAILDAALENLGPSNVTFMTDADYRAERAGEKKANADGGKKSSKNLSTEDAAPGSVAFVERLVIDKKYDALHSLFGNLQRGEFKRVKKYLKTKGVDLTAYEDKKRATSLPIWILATIISVCILTIIVSVWGALEYLKVIDWVSWF